MILEGKKVNIIDSTGDTKLIIAVGTFLEFHNRYKRMENIEANYVIALVLVGEEVKEYNLEDLRFPIE